MSSVPDYRYYVQSTDSRQVLDIVNEAMDHACHGDKSEPRAGGSSVVGRLRSAGWSVRAETGWVVGVGRLWLVV